MPVDTIDESQKMGAPARSAVFAAATTPGVKFTSSAMSVAPAACTMRTTARLTSAGNLARFVSARMIRNDSS